MEERRRPREDSEREIQRKAEEREELERKTHQAAKGPEPPALSEPALCIVFTLHSDALLGLLNTIVRLKYALAVHSTLKDVASLGTALTPFRAVDDASIVISLKLAPPKRNLYA